MAKFFKTGISLEYLHWSVLLLQYIRVNEGSSCLEFQVQQLGHVFLVRFVLSFVHILQRFIVSCLALRALCEQIKQNILITNKFNNE